MVSTRTIRCSSGCDFRLPRPNQQWPRNLPSSRHPLRRRRAPPPPPLVTPKVEPTPPPVEEFPRTYIVFFDLDKADIKPEALVILTQAAANADRIPVTRIQATGHADRSGSDLYNLELSRKRAAAVRAELIRLGVPPQDIVILWKGEREPLVITADGVLEPQNRRVEISLQ